LDVTWPGKFQPDGQRTPAGIPPPVGLRCAPNAVKGDRKSVLPLKPSLLIHADCLAAGGTLVSNFGNAVRLIYCDPPFNSGQQWKDTRTGEVAYDDRWGKGIQSFAHFLWQRLMLARELLTPDGSIFLHGSNREVPLLRALCDDVFGPGNFLNQVVWHYTGGGRADSRFSNKHDLILWYRKGDRHVFNPDAIRVPYKPNSRYAESGITGKNGKRYMPNPGGTVPDDVWPIPMVNPMSNERTSYPTQKPLALLERVVAAASHPGDLVCDLVCGSGTALVAAKNLGRSWIGVDKSQLAIETSSRRMGVQSWLEITNAPAD
jgi:DNA modification methylase